MQAPSVRIDRSDDTIKTNARSRTLSLSLCFFARACVYARALCDENRLKRVKRICLSVLILTGEFFKSITADQNVQRKTGADRIENHARVRVAIYSAITD